MALAWALKILVMAYLPILQILVLLFAWPLTLLGIDLYERGRHVEYTFAYFFIQSWEGVLAVFVYSYAVFYLVFLIKRQFASAK